MVSPIFRKNLYVNAVDNMMQGETPINFFNVNTAKYPLARMVNYIKVALKAGDCMYVPAYFYIQSKTLNEYTSETIIVTE